MVVRVRVGGKVCLCRACVSVCVCVGGGEMLVGACLIEFESNWDLGISAGLHPPEGAEGTPDGTGPSKSVSVGVVACVCLCVC